MPRERSDMGRIIGRAAAIRATATTLSLCLAGCSMITHEPVTRPSEKPTSPTAHNRSGPAAAPGAFDAGTADSRARVVEIGRTVNGNPLSLHVFGDAPGPVLIFAGMHGSEPSSAFVAERLVEHLRANPAAYRGASVAVWPRVNPDGLARRRRRNAHHVDLNRNFPAGNWKKQRSTSRYYGGPAAASEPETLAVMRTVEQLQPRAVISIHSITRGRQCNNFDGPARELAEIMSRHNGYPAKAGIGYPTPGSFGSWAGVERGIPVVTLELPRGRSGRECWQENREALLAVIQAGSGAHGK